MIKLAHNIHLWAFLLVAILIALYVIYAISRSKLSSKIGNKHLIEKLTKNTSQTQKNIKFTIIILALVFLIIGWANPLIGTKYEKVNREGVDIIFAIDVSKSMDAKDVAPSRMLKAKQLVNNMISKMTNHRVGLIVFAGKAYLQMPVTVDYSSSKMYLKSINTNMVPTQGTSIGDAVDLALKSFDTESEGYKTLVVISDGEEHDGNAEKMINLANEKGIKVFTVGVGSEQGGPIPIDNKGNFKKDANGEIVQTKINEAMMSNLSKIGGGTYFNASKKDIDEIIINEINKQEKRKIGEKVFTNFKNQFPLFLSITLILLLIDFIIPERKIKLFNKN